MYIAVVPMCTMLLLYIYVTTVITHRSVAGVIGKPHAINCKAVDCSNRVFDCFNRVYRSVSIFIGRTCTQPTFGSAWALPDPPLATPLITCHQIASGLIY